MIKVSMNIGAEGSGSLNLVPMFWEFDTAKDFTNFIRQSSLEILNWMHNDYISKPKALLGVHIVEDIENESSYWEWDFVIHCKNIREFKPYLSLSREDFEAAFESHKREKKLNDILYDEK